MEDYGSKELEILINHYGQEKSLSKGKPKTASKELDILINHYGQEKKEDVVSKSLIDADQVRQ